MNQDVESLIKALREMAFGDKYKIEVLMSLPQHLRERVAPGILDALSEAKQ